MRRDRDLAKASPGDALANGRRTSALLRDFVAGATGPRVSLGALRDALGDRGFGVLLFIFALPNLDPRQYSASVGSVGLAARAVGGAAFLRAP